VTADADSLGDLIAGIAFVTASGVALEGGRWARMLNIQQYRVI
jgi:hypothetical protein